MTEQDARLVFSENLRRLMIKNHKKQGDLIESLKVKQSTLSDWLNAKKFPRIDTVEDLAKYFNVPISELIEKQDATKENNQEYMLRKEYFRVLEEAKKKGYDPDDIIMALDFLDRARKRDN